MHGSKRNRGTALLASALVASLATVAQAKGGDSSGGTAPVSKRSGVPTLTAPAVELPTGGFAIKVSKQFTPTGSAAAITSTALVATYDWGGGVEGEAMVVSHGTSWQVIFPVSPPAETQVTLELQYFFEVDSQELAKRVDAVLNVVTQAALASLPNPPNPFNEEAFQSAFKFELSKAPDVLAALDRFHAKDRVSAKEETLRRIGLDPKTLQLDRATLVKVISAYDAYRRQRRNADSLFERAKGQACLGSIAGLDRVSSNDLLASFRACWSESKREAAERLSALNSDQSPRPADLVQRQQSLDDAAKQVDDALGTLSEGSAASRFDALVAPVASWQIKAAEAPIVLTDQLGAALMWPVARAEADAANASRLAELTAEVELQSLRYVQQGRGDVLLERSLERSRWDVATGVVYAFELDDTMMPVLLSFCPVGCLRANEAMWDSGWHVLHAVSIDAGVRAAVFDSTPDARHADRFGMFLGGSVNPFYFLRGSAGMYMFENAQTENWNQALYLGATVNMIHAVEFLGELGVAPPSIKATGKSTSE